MPQNPYNTLKEQFAQWVNKVLFRRRKPMWRYDKSVMPDLWERVSAAQQIGYEVHLKATEKGIEVEYVEGLPQRPYNV